MKSRIERFIRENNITSAKLADSINVNRASISHILSGRNLPSFDFISKFLKRYNEIDANWLMIGKGEMYKNQISNTIPFRNIDELDKSVEAKQKLNLTKPTPIVENELISNETIDTKKQTKVEKVLIFYSDNRIEEFNSLS
ncbi:MAG: helix-turn-helix transcriptional regulator [Bacteroidetes bacterium]|jgi:transcriptional regulator with XRE-family HTH domain|nr:helix-turn-helix transcriptional regulator [Bacteroidota bacterium]MBT6685062.1 helix-turn-helix transcriptional regulator [Bacteroidota bacterium]MBT7144551.1 helix-turn-helix transcriptional regulator [Bacteroidota bacterium]MBT7491784.1 helix-turn-helix transcriptional regulator [Bacteroidota bacterium]